MKEILSQRKKGSVFYWKLKDLQTLLKKIERMGEKPDIQIPKLEINGSRGEKSMIVLKRGWNTRSLPSSDSMKHQKELKFCWPWQRPVSGYVAKTKYSEYLFVHFDFWKMIEDTEKFLSVLHHFKQCSNGRDKLQGKIKNFH